MPWMGFFKKIQLADQFVFLDHVAFSKGSYTNRVKIHSVDGLSNQWLTIPIKKHSMGTPISEIEIDRSKDFEDYLLTKIQNTYKSSPEFGDLFPKFKELASQTSKLNSLSQFNKKWIEFLCKAMGIDTGLVSSSSLSFGDSDQQVVFQICKELEAEIYISGMGGKNYLDEKAFADSNIDVEYSDFIQQCKQNNIDQSLIGKSSISWLFQGQKIH